MRLLIDDDSTCSKDRACAQQPDKTPPSSVRFNSMTTRLAALSTPSRSIRRRESSHSPNSSELFRDYKRFGSNYFDVIA